MPDALHDHLYAALREVKARYENSAPIVRPNSCEFAGRSDYNVPANHRCKSCVIADAIEALHEYEATS